MKWTFPINPVAASRPRVGRYGTYYSKSYNLFRKQAAKIIPETIGAHKLLTGMLGVKVLVARKRPGKTSRSTPVGDVDNYLKAVLDACNERVWVDDDQITKALVQKRWAKRGQEGYVILVVYERRKRKGKKHGRKRKSVSSSRRS